MDIVRSLRKGFTRGKIDQRMLFFFSLLSLVGCHAVQKEAGKPLADNPPNQLEAISDALPHVAYARDVNHVLLAELYSQFGEAELSAKHYQELIADLDDPAIARRATILAASSGQNQDALNAVRLWAKLLPGNLEALQYYALLLLRNDDYNESVEKIHLIRQLVENEKSNEAKTAYNEGLKFIGSMLNIESHHEKSLAVFQRYIDQFGSKKDEMQLNLILSSLAMKAKKYQVALTALNAVNNPEAKSSSKIVQMKVKALQGLDKLHEAVETLTSFVENQQVSDSLRLQLVRLLILDHQKEKAEPYLRRLVKKYPDNNDLLKSLIALEIDQSKLRSAKRNIKKLGKSKEYFSDAAYFRAEIYEAEGDFQSALSSYQQVVDGSLQDRAKKKIMKLGEGSTLRKVNKVNYKGVSLKKSY